MTSKIKDIIDYFSHHEVSTPVRQRVWQRLASSGDDEDNDAYNALWDEGDRAQMSDEEVARAYRRFSTTMRSLSRGHNRMYRLWRGRIAAILVPIFIIGIAAACYFIGKGSQTREIAMIQRQTALGQTVNVVLPDSSTVTLKEGSMLIYPSEFSSKERKVYLAGRATFDIRHDARHPLSISTPHFEITDIGTKFEVNSYPDGEEPSATVSSGKIELHVRGQHQYYRMGANDILIYDARNGGVRTAKGTAKDIKWMTAQLNFDDKPFTDVVNTLSATYGAQFKIQNSKFKIQNPRITVHFNEGETLENVMRIIAMLVPDMKYTIQNGEVTVY